MNDVEAILQITAERLLAGDSDLALHLLTEARRKHPSHPELAGRYADALQASGRLEPAAEAYRKALALDSSLMGAWYGLGSADLELKAFGAAVRALTRAVESEPDLAAAHYGLGKALFELGQADAALAHFRRARKTDDPKLAALAQRSIACIIPGAASAGEPEVLRERQGWAALEGARAGPVAVARPRAVEGRRLKVGYLSAFFGAANWMKAVFPVINRHDRTRFEVHMISDGENPSEASGYRDWPDDYVHDIRGLDNDRAAAVLRDVGLDVLVDLNGYSFQARTPLLLRRPAPVILGWFNYFATSGIAPVDALIGDETVIDPAAAGHYSERCIALPGCYLGFEVDYPVPEVTAPPSAAGAGGLTFGCLGSQYKLDDALVAAWARILAAAPASRLFLKNATLEDASSRGHLRARLEQAGIAQDRVELSGRDDHFDFLAAYGQIDIALDTFPYNGGTTTCEALWQGVPVLAIAGDRWVNRVSASILKASDLGDWVTPDVDAFVRRAADLANDPETPGRLAALRSGMRDRLRRAPICDGEALTRSLEAIYVSEAERAAQSVL